MKKLNITGIALLISLTAFSQDFLKQGKSWSVVVWSMGIPQEIITEIYKLEGDSIVNDKNYKKLWLSADSTETWHYQGLLRETDNRIYYVPPNRPEGVLYDFNLEVGDTTRVINFVCSDIPIKVFAIDTVENNGKMFKRWAIGQNEFHEYWYEDVGSQLGPIHTSYWYCLVCPTWDLLCCHEGDSLLFMHGFAKSCYVNTVGVEENGVMQKIVLSPNPVLKGETLTIEMNYNPTRVEVYNSSGVLMTTRSSFQNNFITIETSNFDNGLYILSITDRDNFVQTRKIIVR